MATTLKSMREKVASRLGDNTFRLWSRAQIDKFINNAQDEFCRKSEILREAWPLDEVPITSNYNWAFELQFMHANPQIWTSHKTFGASDVPLKSPIVKARMVYERTTYEHGWERDYANGGHGPANHEQVWERDQFSGRDLYNLLATVSATDRGYEDPVQFLRQEEIPGTIRLPELAVEVLRVTWDGRRVWPQRASSISDKDRMFEQISGMFDQYTIARDGLRFLRKYRKPGARGSVDVVAPTPSYAGALRGFGNYDDLQVDAYDYFNKDFWNYCGLPTPGTLFITSDSPSLRWGWSGGYWDGYTFTGSRGIVRHLPGMRVSGGPRGMIRKLSYDNTNTVLEARRRPKQLVVDGDTFDVPEPLLRGIRDKAQAMALDMAGPGQNSKLSTFYNQRFESVVALARTWMSRVHKIQRRAYGRVQRKPHSPGRVQWPYHYSGPQGWKV